MKLHLGNCSDHPDKNDPTINCWAIRDDSNRRLGNDELLELIQAMQARLTDQDRAAIASSLAPLTDDQVAAYRRLPGSFGSMLQACFNDGWNAGHALLAGEVARLDGRVAELEAERDALLAQVEQAQDGLGEGVTRPHSSPEKCPTFYDVCRCSVECLVFNIERAEAAERLMGEAVRDFHGKSVLFSSPFLEAAKVR